MKIIDSKNSNDIVVTLKRELDKNRIDEMNIVLNMVRSGINQEENIDLIESTYEFNLEKLSKIEGLKVKSVSKLKKFLDVIYYMENLPLTNSNFLNTILTTGALLELQDVENLKIENLYLISTVLISVPIKNYKIYTAMFDEEILDNIYSKTKDYFEMRKICYDILEYCEANENINSKDDILKIINDSQFNYSKIKL